MADSAIRSFRDGVLQIMMITIGVIIGLWFDSLVSWRTDRALVREARANLTSEIRDNRQRLDRALQLLENELAALEHAQDVAQLGLERKSLKNNSVSLSFSPADLQTASRTSAEMTGAMALMPYDEVKRYASVYGQQQLVVNLQTEIMRSVMHAIAFVPILENPEKASPREFEAFRDTVREAGALLYSVGQLGRGLLNEYDKILTGP